MTALAQYALLEALGRYAEAEDAPSREVVLRFGAASLTILRFEDETPIAHWPLGSLALISRNGPTLTLAPDAEAPERLALHDPDMVDALRRVCPALIAERTRARAATRGGLWRWMAALVAMVGLALGAVALWPTALDRAAEATPPAGRAALGDAAVEAFAEGRLCAPDARGARALRVAASELGVGVSLRVAQIGRAAPVALIAPGNRLILNAAALGALDRESLLEDAAARLAAHRPPKPVRSVLEAIGPPALLPWARGNFTDAAMVAFAAQGLRAQLEDRSDWPERAAALVADGPDWAALRRTCGAQ